MEDITETNIDTIELYEPGWRDSRFYHIRDGTAKWFTDGLNQTWCKFRARPMITHFDRARDEVTHVVKGSSVIIVIYLPDK